MKGLLRLLLLYPGHRCKSCGSDHQWGQHFCAQCGARQAIRLPILPIALALFLTLGMYLVPNPEKKSHNNATDGLLSAHGRDMGLGQSPQGLMDEVDRQMKSPKPDGQRIIELLDAAIAQQPKYGYALRLKANLLRHQGKGEASLEAWRIYLTEFPNDAHAAYTLAQQLIKEERHEEAAGWLEKLLQEHPNFAKGHQTMAEVQKTLGNQQAAQHHQDQANQATNKPLPRVYHPRVL